MVAAKEAAAIGALDAADGYAARTVALIDDSALDAPELWCRAVLLINDCRWWTGLVGDPAALRALAGKAGRLAVEHGWADIAARAALAYGLNTGVTDPTGAELIRAALDMGAADDWRPALAAIAARLELEDGDGAERERAIAAVDAAATEIERCDPIARMLVADTRWWLHFPEALVDPRLEHDVRACRRCARRGAGSPGVQYGAHRVPATRRPRRLRRSLRGIHCLRGSYRHGTRPSRHGRDGGRAPRRPARRRRTAGVRR